MEWSTRHVEDPYPLAISMVEGTGRKILFHMMNVLGGMAFHLLWETQARYMIPYYMLLFPAASAGIISAARYLPLHLQKD